MRRGDPERVTQRASRRSRPRRRLRQRMALVAGAALGRSGRRPVAGRPVVERAASRSDDQRWVERRERRAPGGLRPHCERPDAKRWRSTTTSFPATPNQPVALTAEGWIYAQAGVVPKAMSLLEKAESADPGYDLPHFYRALVLLDDQGRRAAAARELEVVPGPRP